MGETGASMCQVKQLPCHSVPLFRLQACGHHTHNHSNLSHKPCLSDPSQVASCGTATALRHRVSGATAGTCNSPNCTASKLGQEVGASAWDGYKGKMLVTGGGGYFGFRLAKDLASEGMTVILLDVNKPPWDIPDGAIFFQVILKGEEAFILLHFPQLCLFSYNFSTDKHVLPSCIHIDHYSRTKAVAERMVLSANGSSVKGAIRSMMIRNITVSHTFKIDKARGELGYSPKLYSLADSVEHYLKSRQSRASPLPLNRSSIRQLTQWDVLLPLMGLSLVLLIFYGILTWS
ncbi:hypothetical protein GOODEAATRI_003526 [Goodea atripinnis]|uniref:3-beta hydroxysteroid dehydrogenase/isomerase domain-containing protein n=1 Tax=Goodea atripinnis TaxID=208336 RepID=A0ABV0PB30_9TELE